jgi:hypothetical protein
MTGAPTGCDAVGRLPAVHRLAQSLAEGDVIDVPGKFAEDRLEVHVVVCTDELAKQYEVRAELLPLRVGLDRVAAAAERERDGNLAALRIRLLLEFRIQAQKQVDSLMDGY